MKQIKHKIFIVIFILAYCGYNQTQLCGSQKVMQSISNGTPILIKTQGTDPHANVHCGIQDKAGNLWFGTTGEGVYRYDGKSFTNFTTKDGLNSNCIYSILEDRNGNIWFGTDSGICTYNARTVNALGKSISRVEMTTKPASYPNASTRNYYPSKKNEVTSMMQDRTGKIWFGTSEGVFYYNALAPAGTPKIFTHFLESDGILNKDNLQLKMVQSIKEDKMGSIWFATWFEGVCRYTGQSITSYKPNGEVWYSGILIDRKGRVWAGRRDKGVCCFNGKNFVNVLQNGILDSCCVRPLIEDKWGNIWFGSEYGDMKRRSALGGIWRYDANLQDGQGDPFKNFTTSDGLTNNAVFCAVKDRDGFIWVGTRNTGLCRYDTNLPDGPGKPFTSFSE